MTFQISCTHKQSLCTFIFVILSNFSLIPSDIVNVNEDNNDFIIISIPWKLFPHHNQTSTTILSKIHIKIKKQTTGGCQCVDLPDLTELAESRQLSIPVWCVLPACQMYILQWPPDVSTGGDRYSLSEQVWTSLQWLPPDVTNRGVGAGRIHVWCLGEGRAEMGKGAPCLMSRQSPVQWGPMHHG